MKQIIKGRITGEINVTTTTSGSQVANFSIAENKAFLNKQTGRKQKVTNFYQMKAWNGVGTSIERNLRKGDLVEFKVDVQPNSWVDGHGELKNELVLTVNRYHFIRESRRQAATANA